MPPTQHAHPANQFRIDRTASGGVTCLAMHGILDESFEGKKVAASVRTKKLVVSLRGVRRFASWGMAEWMNFLRTAAEHDLYLVECSTYAVHQMNLVTGLLGHGKLVSFYLPYRCSKCSEEFETLLVVPRDRAAIQDLAHSERACATCGGQARIEKYPANMREALSQHVVFDMDDEVVAFLRDQLKYELTPDTTRFRAYRRAGKGSVYLRLTGNIAALPVEPLVQASEGTTVVDLANITFDPVELTQWRTYVRTALPAVSSLQLLDCPAGFLERAVEPSDLEGKLKVRTFALPYLCSSCNAVERAMVNVAEYLEQLTEGIVPAALCPICKSGLVAQIEDAALLRRLPAREHDAELDAFLVKARGLPAGKLEDCLATRSAKHDAAAAAARRWRWVYLGSALAVLAAIGGLAVAFFLWKQAAEAVPAPPAAAPATAVAPPPAPAFQRPDWITSGVPSSSFCEDLTNRLVCVGISPYRRTKEEAVNDADDAALDELVNAIGLKISDPRLRDSVLPGYSEARAKALSALQAVDTDRASADYAAADDVVRKARKRVAEVLRVSGGAGAPPRRSDWYWEAYSLEKGSGIEFLGFVRYDVSSDAVKSLVETYSVATQIDGAAVVTAFPGLAWEYPDFAGGAQLRKMGGPLAGSGVAAQALITAVGDQPVRDAAGLARRLEEWKPASGSLSLTVKTGSAPAQVIKLSR
jgi:hypothetical protein